MSFVRNIISDVFGGDDAAAASLQASEAQTAAQREALEYLQSVDEPLLGLRDEALPLLAGFYGLGDASTQQQIIDQVQSSPFYQANLEDMEQSILRNAAATGGLRSGAAQEALADAQTRALQGATGQFLGGLQNFANPNLTVLPQAQIMQDIGQTQAQGIVGAEQGRQAAFGQGLQTIIGGVSAATGGGFI